MRPSICSLLPGGLFRLMNHCSGQQLCSFRDPVDTNSLAVRGESDLCVCVRREGETFLPLQPLCRRSMLLVISGICCPTLTFALCCHLKSFVLNSLNPHQGVGKHESRRSKRREGRLRSGGGVCARLCGEKPTVLSLRCVQNFTIQLCPGLCTPGCLAGWGSRFQS